MMKKAQQCKVRFNDMLYQYRTSPVAGRRESPIEILEQRRPRTNMQYLGKNKHRQLITPHVLERFMRNQPLDATCNWNARETVNRPNRKRQRNSHELTGHRYPLGIA